EDLNIETISSDNKINNEEYKEENKEEDNEEFLSNEEYMNNYFKTLEQEGIDYQLIKAVDSLKQDLVRLVTKE
ncbi:MAG: hypothetical protein Q4F88_05840, partial [Eubacteriales bacterium]|nr:hypothetical protein [Eubacteriales bacterium]